MRWQWVPPARAAASMARALLGEGGDDGEEPRERAHPLTPFQAAAVRRARDVLARRGGVIIADEVGLGKTYVGLALVEDALRAGHSVVVAVPAALRPTWSGLLDRLPGGPVAGPPLVTTHTRLSRGTVDPARLARADLVVVDEAHAFRNPATRRYRALGRRKPGSRLVLITATPVNNGPADLHALVRLFAADADFRDAGIISLRAALLGEGGEEAAARVARAVVIRRGRANVTGGGRTAGDRAGAVEMRFPRRRPPELVRYADPRIPGLVAGLTRLELAPYRQDPERQTAALVRLGLLKRLESGVPALVASLRRLRSLLAGVERAAGEGRLLLPRDPIARAGDGDAVQLVLDSILLDPAAPHADLGALAVSCRRDARRIDRLLRGLRGPDPKVDALRAWLEGPGRGRKVLIFTEFRDTAAALHAGLATRGGVGRVDGGGAWLGLRPSRRRSVLERFAPRANGRPPPSDRERVDVLIATDVLSEGVNLQDAEAVLSYDVPWNPVRLLQRVGRVDRLGSPHEEVTPVVFVPEAGLDELLRLTRRLRRKLRGIVGAVGARDAGELLARLARGDVDPGDRAETVNRDPDPWERLRTRLEAAPPPSDPTTCAVLSRVVVSKGSGSGIVEWLVLLNAGWGPMLVHVDAAEVAREAGTGAGDLLIRGLESGHAPPPASIRRALEVGARRAAGVALRLARERSATLRAPRPIRRATPEAAAIRRVRRAIAAAGPVPSPDVLARAERQLRDLDGSARVGRDSVRMDAPLRVLAVLAVESSGALRQAGRDG